MSDASSASPPILGRRVAVSARDNRRRELLVRELRSFGHSVVDEPALAEVVLIVLAPGEAQPPGLLTPPAVVLSGPVADDDGVEPAGLLPRDASSVAIDAAVRAVASGLSVRERRTARPSNGFAAADDDASHALLTPRELEILSAVGDGLSNKGVARRLGISAHTVKFHMEAIFAKLDAATRAEAVAKGLKRGLIEV
jgi:DNA-binding CsgD family transcriptional regulator